MRNLPGGYGSELVTRQKKQSREGAWVTRAPTQLPTSGSSEAGVLWSRVTAGMGPGTDDVGSMLHTKGFDFTLQARGYGAIEEFQQRGNMIRKLKGHEYYIRGCTRATLTAIACRQLVMLFAPGSCLCKNGGKRYRQDT